MYNVSQSNRHVDVISKGLSLVAGEFALGSQTAVRAEAGAGVTLTLDVGIRLEQHR